MGYRIEVAKHTNGAPAHTRGGNGNKNDGVWWELFHEMVSSWADFVLGWRSCGFAHIPRSSIYEQLKADAFAILRFGGETDPQGSWDTRVRRKFLVGH